MEMKQQSPDIDIEYAKCCIMANQKNNLTAHYELLIKKKSILGESISDFSDGFQEDNRIIPMSSQVRAHHSIPAAPRHNIGNLDKVRN